MSFFFFSSSTYRNCSFTIECLKNSLQILCIYAELLNSAVCCSFFFGAFGVSGGSETVTTSARRPPKPAGLGAARCLPSARLRATARQRRARCPRLSMHCLSKRRNGGGPGVLSQLPGMAPTRPHPDRKPQMHKTGTLFPVRALSVRVMPIGVLPVPRGRPGSGRRQERGGGVTWSCPSALLYSVITVFLLFHRIS